MALRSTMIYFNSGSVSRLTCVIIVQKLNVCSKLTIFKMWQLKEIEWFNEIPIIIGRCLLDETQMYFLDSNRNLRKFQPSLSIFRINAFSNFTLTAQYTE